VTPPPRRSRWPRIVIASAVCLLCGGPIAIGIAESLRTRDRDVVVLLVLLAMFVSALWMGAVAVDLTERSEPRRAASWRVASLVTAGVTAGSLLLVAYEWITD
jgi:hypothetical protein